MSRLLSYHFSNIVADREFSAAAMYLKFPIHVSFSVTVP